MSVPEVIAAFRRTDLLRLHVLLTTYQSPFSTGEAAERREDEAAHRALCREVERLLASSADVPVLGADGGKL